MNSELITVTAYDDFRKKFKEVEDTCDFIPDVSSQDGYEKSKRIAIDVGKILTSIEKKRKELKSESLERGRLIDAEAKTIVEKFQTFQLPHKEAYKELDNLKKDIEAARKADLEQQVKDIIDLPEAMKDADSSMVKIALEDLISNKCLSFYEYTMTALQARDSSKNQLSKMFGEKLKQEKDAAELADLRRKQSEQEQKDRDELIRKKAAEKADAKAKQAKEAEQRAIDQAAEAVKQREQAEARIELEAAAAEANRIQAEDDDEKSRIEAEKFFKRELAMSKQKAKDEAAIAAEDARKSEVARVERILKEEEQKKRKLEADKIHVGKILKETKDSLMALGLSEELAKKVVLAIKNKSVPNLKFEY